MSVQCQSIIDVEKKGSSLWHSQQFQIHRGQGSTSRFKGDKFGISPHSDKGDVLSIIQGPMPFKETVDMREELLGQQDRLQLGIFHSSNGSIQMGGGCIGLESIHCGCIISKDAMLVAVTFVIHTGMQKSAFQEVFHGCLRVIPT